MSADMIMIVNEGPELRETNFFDTEQAESGFYYLTRNAGTSRLLVPDSRRDQLAEMATGKIVVLTRGRMRSVDRKMNGRDMVEIMFDDGSNAPYALHILADMVDMLPAPGPAGFPFTVWTRDGKALSFTAHYRRQELPCLKPWK